MVRRIRNIFVVMILGVLLFPVHTVSAGTFAGQNGRIAFSKGNAGVWTVRPNGSQARQLGEQQASDLAWSPDGSLLAMVEPRQNGATRLKIVNNKTGATQDITRSARVSDSSPVWSSEGHLAFVRTKQEPGATRSAVFSVRVSSNDLINVSGWSKNKSHRVPSWSPDNKRLAYEEIDEATARILIKNLENGDAHVLTEMSDTSHSPLLSWSPSGKKLLFNDSEGQIYTIWADGTHRSIISDGDSYGASWSPDGSRIAFLEDFSGESISISEPDGTIRYIVVDLQGYGRVDAPVWSPNGKQLVFAATEASTGRQNLFSMAVAGTTSPRKIATDVIGVIAWQAT